MTDHDRDARQQQKSNQEDQGSAAALEQAQRLQPETIIRIASMARELLGELHQTELDETSRDQLKSTYESSVRRLGEGLPDELQTELEELRLPLADGPPSEAELRIAHAQLVGWLEGLFHGIQATMYAQQRETQSRLHDMRQQGLPTPPQQQEDGTYL